jgi:Putative bacterial sensory transduction regulator
MKTTKLLLGAALLLGLSVPAWAASPNKIVVETSSSEESSAMEMTSSEEPAPAPASGGLVTAGDPQSVLDELSALGYPGKLGQLDGGRQSISVRIAGLNTYIDFYDCADDMTNCYTLLLGVDIDLKDGTTPGKVNEWNSKQITGRVYLNDDADPTLDYSISTFDGISTDVFDQNIKLWAQVIDDFKSTFNFR